MAHPGGRPSEYSEEIVKKAQKYLDSCKDKTEQHLDMENEQKGYQKFKNKLKVKLPTIEGLAVYLKVARDTIYEWEKIHKEFSDIIGDLRATQAQRLIDNGLSGDYNPTIAKVLLAKHGYKDAQEVDQNIKGSISLTDLFNKAKE
jgi:hypothetical protein